MRDVPRSYRLLARPGDQAVSNVGRGESISTAEQVETVRELLAPIEVEHRVNPARVRAQRR